MNLPTQNISTFILGRVTLTASVMVDGYMETMQEFLQKCRTRHKEMQRAFEAIEPFSDICIENLRTLIECKEADWLQ